MAPPASAGGATFLLAVATGTLSGSSSSRSGAKGLSARLAPTIGTVLVRLAAPYGQRLDDLRAASRWSDLRAHCAQAIAEASQVHAESRALHSDVLETLQQTRAARTARNDGLSLPRTDRTDPNSVIEQKA